MSEHLRFRGLEPTPVEQRVSFRSPGFPEWVLSQDNRFAAANRNNDWFDEVIALPAQIYPNCFVVCWVNLIMDLIRREFGADAIPEGYALDYNGIYERLDAARAGDRTAGGQMDTVLKWAPEHEGWFEDVRWMPAYFPYRPEFAERMLAVMPFCIGMATHSGWFAPDDNGYIRPGLPNPMTGHAVHVVDHQWRGNTGYSFFPLQWGYDIGHNGYACMADQHIVQSQLSDCVTLYLPDGVGRWWEEKLVEIPS